MFAPPTLPIEFARLPLIQIIQILLGYIDAPEQTNAEIVLIPETPSFILSRLTPC